jgi:hypothetical protein
MVSSLHRLVLASALVNAGEASEALEELDKLQIFSLPVRWRQQAQWVHYLALRDLGRTTDAHEQLEALADDEGEMGDRAKKELERLGGR